MRATVGMDSSTLAGGATGAAEAGFWLARSSVEIFCLRFAAGAFDFDLGFDFGLDLR